MTEKSSRTAAVVGTGFIGPVHVEALKRAGIHVAGMLGSTPEKSKRAALELGLGTGYPALEAVLNDSSVDVVHLASPNRLHFAQAKSVLEAGKHVLCEKPLAMNSAETSELVKLALDRRLAAGVAYNIRFYPLCHEAAHRVASDSWGRTLHVSGSYVQDWLLHEDDFNWRVVAEEGGELRAVADIGTHWLDLVQFITGQKVTAVCADLQIVHASRNRPVGASLTFSKERASQTESVAIDTEDAGNILLKFGNGTRGCLHVSQTTAGRKNCLRFEIAGSNQTLSFNSERPNELWIGHRNQPNDSLIRDPGLMGPRAAKIANYPGGHAEGFPDTFKQLFRTFYDYIDAGDFTVPASFPTFQDGHREVLLCEAILKSHRDACWVHLDPEQQI